MNNRVTGSSLNNKSLIGSLDSRDFPPKSPSGKVDIQSIYWFIRGLFNPNSVRKDSLISSFKGTSPAIDLTMSPGSNLIIRNTKTDAMIRVGIIRASLHTMCL